MMKIARGCAGRRAVAVFDVTLTLRPGGGGHFARCDGRGRSAADPEIKAVKEIKLPGIKVLPAMKKAGLEPAAC
jgi:hypothetical protein